MRFFMEQSNFMAPLLSTVVGPSGNRLWSSVEIELLNQGV